MPYPAPPFLVSIQMERSGVVIMLSHSTAEKMLLTAQNGSEEVCTYEKKALSETDKAEAILVTKSAQDGPRFL
jgi:hypothetical protein